MPKQDFPRSDKERRAFLNQCAAKAAEDAAVGVRYLTVERVNQVNAFAADFGTAVDLFEEKQTAHTEAIADLKKTMKHLRRCLLGTWTAATLEVSSGRLPQAALSLYKVMPLKQGPRATDYHAWFNLTSDIITGAAALVRAGHTPVATPSAADLQAAREAAEAALKQKMTAETALDSARTVLNDKRDEAQGLIQDVSAELRLHLRPRSPAARRQVMRAYGVRFIYRADETPDPSETSATAGAGEPAPAA